MSNDSTRLFVVPNQDVQQAWNYVRVVQVQQILRTGNQVLYLTFTYNPVEQIAIGNTLYEGMWLYHNLFQPVMHLSEKTVDGDKVRRTWFFKW